MVELQSRCFDRSRRGRGQPFEICLCEKMVRFYHFRSSRFLSYRKLDFSAMLIIDLVILEHTASARLVHYRYISIGSVGERCAPATVERTTFP